MTITGLGDPAIHASITPVDAVTASYPPEHLLPAAAVTALEPLWAIRERAADAQQALAAATKDLENARLADASALLEHVRSGGKAAEFIGSAKLAEQDLAHARTDAELIARLANEQAYETARAVRATHAEGASIAAKAAADTAARYRKAIAALVDVRREYVTACSAQLFWRSVLETGSLAMGGGDQVIVGNGPLTKVDDTTMRLLQLDATTHERIPDARLRSR